MGKLYKETLTLIRPVDHCVFRNFNCVAHLHNRGTALLNQDQRTISPRLPLPSIAITSEASSIRHISCSSPDPTRLHIHLLATFCSFCFCLLRRICPGYSLPPARSGQLRKRKHEGLPNVQRQRNHKVRRLQWQGLSSMQTIRQQQVQCVRGHRRDTCGALKLALFPERAGTQRCVLAHPGSHGASAQPQGPLPYKTHHSSSCLSASRLLPRHDRDID
ncbi:hypothetical protein CUC08_Gglean011826 [Alternaria sp. MG1]|jgi:hypothetical protein|nr:hypothetical protein CUC08_Gglean011826 [Alternaria sp. MG1]